MPTQGQRLKKIRLALNLSQEQLGLKLGVSKQYISNIEADRNVLNNEKLVSLLVDFNININYILSGLGTQFIKTNPSEITEEFRKNVRVILKEEGLITSA